MIRFDNVSRAFKDTKVALMDVSADIEAGEFVFLVGPSGAGKSTFLQLILRQLLPTEGSVYVDGQDTRDIPPRHVPYLRRRVGFVFQDFKLLDDRSIYHNLSFVMRATDASTREIKRRVPEVLDWVGLGDRLDAMPYELSGGEQQRVAIARAIINNPLIVLADEPTGNLDPATSRRIVDLLDRVNQRGSTVLVATHDAPLVNRYQRRVITLRSGRLVRDQQRGAYAHEA